MIEFNGEIKVKCKLFIRQKEELKWKIISLLGAAIFAIPVVIILFDWGIRYLPLYIFVPAIPFCITVLSGRIPLSKKNEQSLIPKRICVDYEFIVQETETGLIKRKKSEVKSVVDYGDWYVIRFSFPAFFVCQKNLLIKGSIEEFEAQFEDKILKEKEK